MNEQQPRTHYDEKRRQLPLFSGVSLNTRSFESGYRTSPETRARNRRRLGLVAKGLGVLLALWALYTVISIAIWPL